MNYPGSTTTIPPPDQYSLINHNSPPDLAPQSIPLDLKFKTATYAEACKAKSIASPKCSSVKVTTQLQLVIMTCTEPPSHFYSKAWSPNRPSQVTTPALAPQSRITGVLKSFGEVSTNPCSLARLP